MWVYAVIVEHSVMLTRVCILVFFPVYPDWIGDAKDVLRFRVGEMKKLSRARRERLEDVSDYTTGGASPMAAVTNNSKPVAAQKLKGRKFRHADVDGDRRLTREEFIHEVRLPPLPSSLDRGVCAESRLTHIRRAVWRAGRGGIRRS